MKSKILLAGALLASGNVASANYAMPAICNTAVNYAALAMNLSLHDASVYDTANDPNSVHLRKDFKKFPVTNVKDLGNCEEDNSFPAQWCQVAGGSPEVYQVDVSKSSDANNSYPFATFVVTFNRGGCWVDTSERK